jgi:hypothetical protein
MPANRRVAVLAISPSSRPGALRPQILPLLTADKRLVLLINKPDRIRFAVSTTPLVEGMDDGARAISVFQERYEAGDVDLTAVYPKLPNRDLARSPSIATMLRLKGIDLNAVN